MKQHILITGATGMLGKELINTLLQHGHSISILSRKAQEMKGVKVFLWDIEKQTVDPDCIRDVDSIIHLAGESISAKKWSDQRKEEIIDSRVKSTELLLKTLKENSNKVKTLISAAAVGIYGDRADEILFEEAQPGNDFLAECCIKWEAAAEAGKALGLRVVKLRTGVVLDKESGALKEMAKPIKLFAGAALGSGRQWVPWIHHQDMTDIYIHALENTEMEGTFNSCAPSPVTNKTLTIAIAKHLHRPVWPFNVPKAMMKLLLGEMSAIILNSNRTAADKLTATGYKFRFPQIDPALSDIYR